MMKISVVIPCLNGERFLGVALEALLNQSRPPDEVIVVDYGSTDGSLALAESYGGQIATLTCPEPGATAARIAGYQAASGEAIMFLDADDLIAPDTLEALAAALADNPDAVARCPWFRFEPLGEIWTVAPASCAPRRPGQDDLMAWLTGWWTPPCGLLWSRVAYERSGGWDKHVRLDADRDVMMRGLIGGNQLIATGRGTAYYRRLPGQMNSNARRSRTGVQSRLFVLERIARLLEQEGRLDIYTPALAEAYGDVLACAADDQPDLADRCREAIARLGRDVPTTSGKPARRRLLRSLSDLRDRAGRRRAGWSGAAAQGSQHFTRPAEPLRIGCRSRSGNEASLVSVIIPAYNRAKTLPRAIDSVLAQDWPALEILVVDDGSTDDTASVVAGYTDPRVRLIRQENQGVAGARNRGMREAAGSFIAFLDSDDEWLPGKLRRQMEVFASGPRRLGLVCTGLETIDAAGHLAVDVATQRGDLLDKMLVRNLIHGGGSNAVIRREVVDLVGGFDPALPAIEDYDYWIRVARFFSIDAVPEPLARYHDPRGGPGAADRRSREFGANMTARRMLFERYEPEMRRAGVDRQFLMDSARRHISAQNGSRLDAAVLAAKAILRRPGSFKAYPWLLVALMPWGVRQAVERQVEAARRPAGRTAPEPSRGAAPYTHSPRQGSSRV